MADFQYSEKHSVLMRLRMRKGKGSEWPMKRQRPVNARHAWDTAMLHCEW